MAMTMGVFVSGAYAMASNLSLVILVDVFGLGSGSVGSIEWTVSTGGCPIVIFDVGVPWADVRPLRVRFRLGRLLLMMSCRLGLDRGRLLMGLVELLRLARLLMGRMLLCVLLIRIFMRRLRMLGRCGVMALR